MSKHASYMWNLITIKTKKCEMVWLTHARDKNGSVLNGFHVGSESHEITTHLLSHSVFQPFITLFNSDSKLVSMVSLLTQKQKSKVYCTNCETFFVLVALQRNWQWLQIQALHEELKDILLLLCLGLDWPTCFYCSRVGRGVFRTF